MVRRIRSPTSQDSTPSSSLCRLALARLLHRARDRLHVVHRVPELLQQPQVNALRAQTLLQPLQLHARFFHLQAHAPETFAGRNQLHHNSVRDAFPGIRRRQNARLHRLGGEKISQHHPSSDIRIIRHLQQPAMGVHLPRDAWLLHQHAIRSPPTRFHGHSHGKSRLFPAFDFLPSAAVGRLFIREVLFPRETRAAPHTRRHTATIREVQA